MRAFLAGIIIAVLLIGAGVAYYFVSGKAPAAVEDKPMPMEKFFANKALHTHIEKEMPQAIPIAADETTYLAGPQVYQDDCAICHGLPNVDQTPMAKGMFPKPPALFKGHGVTDDPAGETFWKVANGIRLTGMPEFKHSLNNTQMWQVSLLLANADKISDAVRDKLRPPSMPGATGAAVPPPTHVPAKPGRVPISPHSTPTM